jgi:hypothetical protein
MRNVRLLPANTPELRELEQALSAAAARSTTALPAATGFTGWPGRWYAWWGARPQRIGNQTNRERNELGIQQMRNQACLNSLFSLFVVVFSLFVVVFSEFVVV